MRSGSHSWWVGGLAVVLAVACFAEAVHFQGKWRTARRQVTHALREAATRDRYLLRAWWMFYGCLGVWAVSLVMTLRHRCRANWLAVVVVGVIALAIPLGVLWVI